MTIIMFSNANNSKIEVRQLEYADCPAVVEVYRHEQGWYNTLTGCRDMFSRGQRCGLYQTIALRNGIVLGIAEWLLDRDERGTYLYLTELQVKSDSQQQGIGRTLVANGAGFARTYAASRLLTIPETETGSQHFYAKCGFISEDAICALTIPSTTNARLSRTYIQVDSVPLTVLERPFLFGAAQWSPRHEYHVYNDKPFLTDPYERIAFRAENGDTIQFRYKRDYGIALGWCAMPSADCISDTLALANTLGVQSVDFKFYQQYTPLFATFGTVEQSAMTMSCDVRSENTLPS
ncbi:MAG: GNAT family N-acetyltransferase [Lachnospiraceae bacterium]|jgi:predicted N-acetyltransferase YhbS|nr:GNAT family N-acetyltransferase [Lachnospiraceae bacterium]